MSPENEKLKVMNEFMDKKKMEGNDSNDEFFSNDSPLLCDFEQVAKGEGLHFTEELIFKGGEVYRGKSHDLK